MTERWRCFVGIPLGTSFRDEMTGLVASLQSASSAHDLRWGDPRGWHLTLAFLGDVAADAIPELASRLPGLSRGPSLTLVADEMLAWPRPEEARMVWCRFRSDPRLAELHQRVAGALGVLERRRFRPHLTLARVPGGHSIAVGEWGRRLRVPIATSLVEQVVLFRSHLGRGGSWYEPLATAAVGEVPA